jgi:hypothetical protein
LLADEGDDVVLGGKRGFAVGTFHNGDRTQQALITRLGFTECQPPKTDL